MKIAAPALLLLALTACSLRSDQIDAEAPPSPCQPVLFEDTPLTHCTADPARHEIGLEIGPNPETPWGSLRTYASAHSTNAASIALVMNAGMFGEDGQPIGYYVARGNRLKPVNQNKGPGNFHMLPNGIFFGEKEGPWQVLATDSFVDTIEHRPDFATQSGPMLVIEGELHPDFDADGDSRKIRNAVGIDLQGRAHFVISDAPVSFGRLARYFRDVLKVPNALFLDGSVSQIWDPAAGRLDTGPTIGPLIVVRNKAKASR